MFGKRQRATMNKRWWCVTLGAIVILSVGAALWTPAHAQNDPTPTPNVNWVQQPLGINVRSGPGLQYGPIGALPVGAWVQPLARDLSGAWVLIAYLDRQGWVRADGVSWRLDIAALPLIDVPSPTAIPRPLYYNTPGGPTYTPNANWVNVGAVVAYVRSGPGRGYSALGLLATGDVVDPVAHDAALDWVLIRYGDGYGWVRYDLVAWATDIETLPMVDVPNLTPSFTPIPILPTATRTPIPSFTPTASATWTPSATSTRTPSLTPTPTWTTTPSLTPTETPSATPSVTSSATASATLTPSATPSFTATATFSVTPSVTPSPSATATATASPSATLTPSPAPSQTSTAPPPSATSSHTPTHTLSSTATQTDTPSATATVTASATQTATSTHTPSATSQVIAALPTEPPSTAPPGAGVPNVHPADKRAWRWWLGGLLGLGALGYAGLYVRHWAHLARYREGFVLSACPICEAGHLHLEERRYRLLGIPRVRRVVRCDVCRSVLREVGTRRWRYAVDGAENPALYDALNGRVLSEDELLRMAPEYAAVQYVEDEEL